MNSKTEEIVIGITVILLGVFVAVSGGLYFEPGNMILIGAGLGFLLMYMTKRQSWALITGCYLLCIGIYVVVSQSEPDVDLGINIKSFLRRNMFLFTTGAIFLIQFYEKNKRGLLIPGCLIFGMCAKNFLTGILLLSGDFISPVIYGLSFYAIYLCGRYFLGSWPKYVAMVLLFTGVLRIFF